ncbi:hypothetical protein [Bacillus suaedaesalsae]|uniref:GNAT family N-acetyltransferase n=1 Tax=Bacillus suaedaesalsae TaxID=2810349 RepID=A0ABS2DFD3_9BACI|nr:hypothetical protein [Bacillus suaedaesalsae]MBM6617177.1 hypothetical protein [Bacillus suaedaesalsae]
MTHEKALIMLCPPDLLHTPPKPLVPNGYYERNYREEDRFAYVKLLENEGWNINDEQLDDFFTRVLPNGLYFLIDHATEEIVSSAVALHNPKSGYYHFPFGGEIGFVFTPPNHRNKGLGFCATALATVTNDHRLPALRTYIKLGYKPFLYSPDMGDRWKDVYKSLNINFSITNTIEI